MGCCIGKKEDTEFRPLGEHSSKHPIMGAENNVVSRLEEDETPIHKQTIDLDADPEDEYPMGLKVIQIDRKIINTLDTMLDQLEEDENRRKQWYTNARKNLQQIKTDYGSEHSTIVI